MASGIKRDGKRSILGVSVSLSEAQAHWQVFLEDLLMRGLHGVQLIISDNHAGLQSARKAVFTGVPRQICQFHLQQNTQAYVSRVDMRREVAEDIRSIFNSPDQGTAEIFLKKAVGKYALLAPKLADWMEVNIPDGFTVFSFPRGYLVNGLSYSDGNE